MWRFLCYTGKRSIAPHGPISVYRNRTWGFFSAKKLPPNIKLEGKTVASNQLAIKV